MHIIEGLLKFFSTALKKRLTFARFSEDHTLSSAEERVSWRSSDGKGGGNACMVEYEPSF